MSGYRFLTILFLLVSRVVLSAPSVQELEIETSGDPDLLPILLTERFSFDAESTRLPVRDHIQPYRTADGESDTAITVRASNTVHGRDNPAVFSFFNQTTQSAIDDDPVKVTVSHFTFVENAGTGRKDIIAGCYRRDSAFALRVVADSDETEMLFLTTGKDHTGNGLWEPRVTVLLVEDYDFDGRQEAFVYVSPARDLQPRELFCVDPDEMEIEWSLPVSSVITAGSFYSCRDSSDPGVLFTTTNVKNGVEDRYFSDRFSYLVRVSGDGKPALRTLLSEEHAAGGLWAADEAGVFYVGHALPFIDPDDTTTLPPHKYKISKIDARGRVTRSAEIPSRLADAWLSKHDNRPDLCLHTLSSTGVVSIYDTSLVLVARSGETPLTRFVDTMRVDGRGEPGFLLRTASSLNLYSSEFDHLAQLPGRFGRYHPLVLSEAGSVSRFILSHRNKECIVDVRRRTVLSFGRILFWKYRNGILIVLTLLALALVVVNSFRQRAVRKLQDSVVRFKEMTDLLPQGVFEINLDSKVTFANRESLRMFGLSQSDLDRGLDVVEVVIPEDRDGLREDVMDVLGGESTGGLEYTAVRKDGSTFPILTYSDCVWKDGELSGIRGVVLDISERRRAEAALRESEYKWRSLVENIPDIIFMVDAEGIIESMDRTLPSLTKEGGVGKNIYDNVAPQHREQLRQAVTAAFDRGEPQSLELLSVGAEGPETAWYETRIVPMERDGRIERLEFISSDITQRRKAQDALKQSEENYRSLVESAEEAIFTIDHNGTYRFVNSIAAKRLGFAPEDMVGRPMAEFFPPEVAERQLGTVRQVFDSGKGRTVESVTVVRGKRQWYRTSLQPVRNSGGEIQAVLCIARDITEAVETQRALGSERDFVRSMLDTSNSLVFCLDKEARITVFNRECERVTGYKREEVMGKYWPDLCVPTEKHRHTREGFVDWVRQHPSDSFEDPIMTRDGELRTILWSNSAMFHPDSDELTAIAVGQDITERKLAEKELQESERKYRHLVEHSLQAIFVIQGERVILANDRLALMLGTDRDRLLGASLVDLMDFIENPKDRAMIQAAYFGLLSEEMEEATFELRIRTGTGSTGWVESIAHRVTYEDKPAVITVLIDISDRIAAESQLQALNAEKYEQAQRIAGGFAHEIRNALFPAEGALYRLAGREKNFVRGDDSDMQRYSAAAAAAVSRAIDITDLITYYTGLDAGRRPESVAVEPLVREVFEANEFAVEDLGVEIVAEGLDEVEVESNRQQLYLVFNNLLLNSLDALTEADKPAIFVKAVKEAGSVRITFGDNGSGISPESLDRVFDTFFSSKPNKGTGLGLAMSRQIVEMYGGTIEVESAPGDGARFEINMTEAETNEHSV